MKLSLRRPFVGSFFLLAAFILVIVGYSFYKTSFGIFGYAYDNFVLSGLVICLFILGYLLVSEAIDPNRPVWVGVLYPIFCFVSLFTFARIVSPCTSPIGIHFMGLNMGDVETYAKAVPPCIVSCACFIIATILVIIASFMPAFFTKKEKAVAKVAETKTVEAKPVEVKPAPAVQATVKPAVKPAIKPVAPTANTKPVAPVKPAVNQVANKPTAVKKPEGGAK